MRPRVAPVQIVCVTTEEPHRHVARVGIGGSSSAPFVTMTVEEVAYAIEGGQQFYTEANGRKSTVHRNTCTVAGCQIKTISSMEDDTVTNDLEYLPSRREPKIGIPDPKDIET
jgi:hypothetical protein